MSNRIDLNSSGRSVEVYFRKWYRSTLITYSLCCTQVLVLHTWKSTWKTILYGKSFLNIFLTTNSLWRFRYFFILLRDFSFYSQNFTLTSLCPQLHRSYYSEALPRLNAVIYNAISLKHRCKYRTLGQTNKHEWLRGLKNLWDHLHKLVPRSEAQRWQKLWQKWKASEKVPQGAKKTHTTHRDTTSPGQQEMAALSKTRHNTCESVSEQCVWWW